MHMHAYSGCMRTTVVIRDDLRARLLELAAERGEKGFSKLVEEALEVYFEDLDLKKEHVRRALGVIGTLDSEAGDRLEKEVRKLRRSWR